MGKLGSSKLKKQKKKKKTKSEESILGIESRSIEEAGIVIGLDSKNFRTEQH